jgi:hypothetical protein
MDSIVVVKRIGELGTTFTVTSNQNTLRNKSVLLLLVTANVHSSPILVTVMMEAKCCSETSVLDIPGDGILHVRDGYTSPRYCRRHQKELSGQLSAPAALSPRSLLSHALNWRLVRPTAAKRKCPCTWYRIQIVRFPV